MTRDARYTFARESDGLWVIRFCGMWAARCSTRDDARALRAAMIEHNWSVNGWPDINDATSWHSAAIARRAVQS